MDNENETSTTGRVPSKAKIAFVGAGIAAGAIGATIIGLNSAAGAATPIATAGYSTSASTSSAATQSGAPKNTHGSAPVRSEEKSVSTSVAATLRAAALKAVPGGTVYRIETDAGDGVYEAHMTKADGTEVTVKFDKNYNVIKVESGMGQGDPAPAGARPPAGGMRQAPAGGAAPTA